MLLAAIGWTGVTAIMGCSGYVFGGWRMAALVVGGFLIFGVLGLWEEAMDTLALTLAAVVLSLLIGVPLGILAGRSDRFMGLISPLLDVMQIMPTFAYLAPLTLFFLIGPASAVIATLIYAVPTTIRITAYGIRGVSPSRRSRRPRRWVRRAWQTLRKVQLPMARRTIILAVNQTMMMALAMVVITALIDAPGLGQNITRCAPALDVGKAFEAGLAIVIMAIVLDRLDHAGLERAERQHRSGVVESPRRRRMIILGAAAHRPAGHPHRDPDPSRPDVPDRPSRSRSRTRSTQVPTGSRRTRTTTPMPSRTWSPTASSIPWSRS